jgi:ubiquinone/menaquinone biosynthesis C-methylase UbiE
VRLLQKGSTMEGLDDGRDGGTYGSIHTAEAWRRSGTARAALLGPLTERMLDLAGIEVGHRVLDVAAGTGEQTLMVARRVGPNGSVLAIDRAAQMLAVAAEAAQQAGLSNVETRVLDARNLDLQPESFDAAISRLALMLIPERAKALAGVRQALKAGKKFVALVLATAEECPYIAMPMATAGRRAGTPLAPFGDPGLFALGEPSVFRRAYERAGFRDVAVEAVAVQRRFASLAAALQNCRDLLPEVSELLVHLSEPERESVWAEIEEALRRFQGREGFVVPQTYLIGVGTK